MRKLTKGIMCMVASAFCFALMGVFVHAAGEINFLQKAFFRNLVALIIASPAAIRAIRLKNGLQKPALKTSSFLAVLLFLFLRSVTGVLGIFGNFYALDRIPIADALMLNKLSPFFAVIFSAIFLRERIKSFPLFCTITALLGAVLVVRPGAEIFSNPAALVAFIGGAGAGAAYTCVRVLGRLKVKGAIIVAFFSAFSCLLCTPCFLHFTPMSFKQWAALIMCGVSAAGGQFGITYAYYYASARDVSIYDYSNVIFAAILAYFIFGQVPVALSFIGYAVIILSALAVFLYNKKNN